MVRRMLERIHGRCCCWVESSLLLLLVQERCSRRGHVEACSTRVLFILDLLAYTISILYCKIYNIIMQSNKEKKEKKGRGVRLQ